MPQPHSRCPGKLAKEGASKARGFSSLTFRPRPSPSEPVSSSHPDTSPGHPGLVLQAAAGNGPMGWERDQGSGVLSQLRPYSLYHSLGLGPHRKGKGAGADDPSPLGSEILVRDRDWKLALPWGLWTGHIHVPPERRSWSDYPHPHPQLTTAAALSAARDVQLRNRPSAPQHSILGERHGQWVQAQAGRWEPCEGCHLTNLKCLPPSHQPVPYGP